MHETGCSGLVHWDDQEGLDGERGGRGFRMEDTCTPTFTAAPFTIARTWKPPRCPSAYEWIGKQWYV